MKNMKKLFFNLKKAIVVYILGKKEGRDIKIKSYIYIYIYIIFFKKKVRVGIYISNLKNFFCVDE